MEMTISEKDLRALSLRLRTAAGRFLKGSDDDGIDNLRRMLDVIDNAPVLTAFIEQYRVTEYDIPNIVESREWDERYPVPIDTREEISFTYQLLKFMSTDAQSPYAIFHYTQGYGEGNNCQRSFEAFAQSVVLPFINHINGYLEGLMEDARQPNSGRVTVNNFGSMGQLNLSQDNSSITASNHQAGPSSAIEEAGAKLLKALQETNLPSDVKADLKEATDMALSQVSKEQPDKSVLKMCGRLLSTTIEKLPAAVTAAKAGKELVDLIAQWIQ